MKYFALVFAVVWSGQAWAGDVDFDYSARMFKEFHYDSYEYDEDQYYDAFPRFVNETRRESLQGDFIETSHNSHGFSSHISAQGSWDFNTASDATVWWTGRGSVIGVVTVNTPGEYYVDAISLHEANAGPVTLTQTLHMPDGSTLFAHNSNEELHQRLTLGAGSYIYRAGYSTSFTFTNNFFDYPWVRQHIRLSVQAVPEPGTLLALGAGAYWLGRKRQSSKAGRTQ